MITIDDKYNCERENIKHGDLILVKSHKPVGRLISWCDNDAYHTHLMIARVVDGRVEIIHSTFGGVKPAYLSLLIPHYIDFNIVKINQSEEIVKNALYLTTYRGGEKKLNYDYAGGVRGLFYKKTGYDIKCLGSQYSDICSEFGFAYLRNNMLPEYSSPQVPKIPFPEDVLRFRTGNVSVITQPLNMKFYY